MDKLDIKEVGIEINDDLTNLFNDLLTKLKKDEEVYKDIQRLGLTVKQVKDNISRLNDHRISCEYCRKCPGIKNCNKENPLLQTSISLDGEEVLLRTVPCKKITESLNNDSLYLRFDADEELKSSSTASFNNDSIRNYIQKEFLNIIVGKSKRWLYLKGNHRVGKSYILAGMVNDFVKSKKDSVAFVDTVNLLKELGDLSYGDKLAFSSEMEKYVNVPLLVLDNFGNEYVNEFVRDQVLFPILNERCRKDRLTFFASELSFNEIQQLYSVGKNSGNIRAKQIFTILTDMCLSEIDVTGISYNH